ncbi:SDR family oxidoreductase [Candidatus Pelagibacter sp.]|uniref:SDR family oxidoreductase n=1 Tax=Candidatus Pelagibacter sp. TaxID=2024849 RepID=UPI003F85C327
MKKSFKTIFITGSDGFVGKNLINHLKIKKNYKIYALTKNKFKNTKSITYIKGNLKSNFSKYFIHTDIIIHCAAKGVYGNLNKKKIYETNFKDSLEFFKKAKKANVSNWIILGTSGEYGVVKKGPMKINTKLKPINDYGKSKVKFFLKLKKINSTIKAKIIYLRLFHVYGKYEKSGRLYPSLIYSINNNKSFSMTDGSEVRDFISIKDAVKMIERSMKFFSSKNKTFFKVAHIANGKPIKVIDFVKKVLLKRNSNIKLNVGKLKKEKVYDVMYSYKKSII